MLVIDPDTGFHSTASLPTVVIFGQENSSTSPVCRTVAWIETSPRLRGAVHCPAVAGVAAAALRGFTEAPVSRAVSEGLLSTTAPAVPAVPVSRNLRRSICPVAPGAAGRRSPAGSAAGERAFTLDLLASPRRMRWTGPRSLCAGSPVNGMVYPPVYGRKRYSVWNALRKS
jgi:hypothetical protein